MELADHERLLTPGEVGKLFRVDPKTVTRWAAAGRISSIRTPGGHRRFRETDVRELLKEESGRIDHEQCYRKGRHEKTWEGREACRQERLKRAALS